MIRDSRGTHRQKFEHIYGWFEGPMAIEVKDDSPYRKPGLEAHGREEHWELENKISAFEKNP